MPNYGTPVYFASLRYMNKKSATYVLRAQQNQEGDTDTVTVYLFLAKLRCRFSKMPNKGIPPCIFRQFTVHWTKISYWGHKTKRGIPIYSLLSRYTSFWQSILCRFSFCLGLDSSLCYVPWHAVFHMHCFSIDWHYGVRTIDYFWSPFPCFVLCFFVPDTLTYYAVFPSGDNSIFYADGRRHFRFLATYHLLYSLGLFGEAPSGDIGFDTYMCGRPSPNVIRSSSSIGPRINHSSAQFCQRHWAQKALLYMRRGGLIELSSKAKAAHPMNYNLSGNLIQSMMYFYRKWLRLLTTVLSSTQQCVSTTFSKLYWIYVYFEVCTWYIYHQYIHTTVTQAFGSMSSQNINKSNYSCNSILW